MQDLGLTENAELPGNIPRRKALAWLVNAGLLLLPLNKANNAQGRLPGKLFELLRAGRPILCLGPANSDAAIIIEETNAGATAAYNDYGKQKQLVEEAYHQFLTKKYPPTSQSIEKYSNYHQTKKLAAFLNNIT
jgi:hypothetical protein